MSISRQIALDEYVRRTRQLAAELREAGLDGVLLSAETNIDYFSGYRHHAPWTLFARPFFQLITADAKALLLGHSFLTPEMARTAAVGDIRAYQRSGEEAKEKWWNYSDSVCGLFLFTVNVHTTYIELYIK